MLQFSSGCSSPSLGVPSKRMRPLSRTINLSARASIFSISCVRTITVFSFSLTLIKLNRPALHPASQDLQTVRQK